MKAAQQQDLAAGGRERRQKRLEAGGQATASIELKRPHAGKAVWAYLRWFEDGKTRNKYIGRVHGEGRAVLLTEAWKLARKKKLL